MDDFRTGGELDKRETAIQAMLFASEALANTLNTVKAVPADFEEDEVVAAFQFDGDDGFETRDDWDIIGGAAYEHGAWVAWHQEHK